MMASGDRRPRRFAGRPRLGIQKFVQFLEHPPPHLKQFIPNIPFVFRHDADLSRCLLMDGPKGTRTLDLYNAIVALSQLSYRPAQE